jgi:hypothetical protein
MATPSLEEQPTDLFLVLCQSILCGKKSHHLHAETEEASND